MMVTFKALNIQKWPLTTMGNIVVPLGEDWHTTTITGLLMCLVGSSFSFMSSELKTNHWGVRGQMGRSNKMITQNILTIDYYFLYLSEGKLLTARLHYVCI